MTVMSATGRGFRFGRPQTWRATAYLAVSMPLAMVWLLLLTTGLLIGGATAVAGIGVLILIATLAGARAIGHLERRLINLLLRARIPVPAPIWGSTWQASTRSLVTDPGTWRSLAWVVLRAVAGLLVLAGAVVAATVCAALLVVPFVDGYLQWGENWSSSAGLMSAWTLPVALAGLLALGWVLRQVAAAHVRVARLLLGPDATVQAEGLAREAEQLSERAALARDLHDGIGHAVTVMVLQADSARHLIDTDPDAARACLRTIAESGRRAMGELDQVLDVLAQDGPARTQPTLADLPGLLRQAETAGVRIQADAPGLGAAARHPDSAVGYRVVQEACTNALRHAPGAPVQVTIRTHGQILLAEVRNGPPAQSQVPPGEPGRGLTGLEERVRLAGGQLTAGPDADGGWLVRVELPGQR